jgi:hypothetical protein
MTASCRRRSKPSSHAKAAKVPIIVAINKMDKPGANPTRVRTDLLQPRTRHRDMGGDVLSVEVSAKKINLDKLEEAILLQAELLDLKANPEPSGHGRGRRSQDRAGRGSVATCWCSAARSRWATSSSPAPNGAASARSDDRGKQVDSAGPGAGRSAGSPGHAARPATTSSSSIPKPAPAKSPSSASRKPARAGARRRPLDAGTDVLAASGRRSQGAARGHQGRRAGFGRGHLGRCASSAPTR